MRNARSRRILAGWTGLLSALVALTVVAAAFSRSDPFQAPYIDNQIHTVDANSDLWFKFDYGLYGPLGSLVTLTLVSTPLGGVQFEIWPPDSIANWSAGQPAGRGGIAELDCITGQPTPGGFCRADNLMWTGTLATSGSYYVHVVNSTPVAASFLLTVQGMAVSLGTPPGSGLDATPTLFVVPYVPPTPPPVMFMGVGPVAADDPTRAVPLYGIPWVIPGNSVNWYKFEYDGKDWSPRQRVFLRLINGVVSGIRFEVWSPQNLPEWWTKKPIGQGTQEVLTNCIVPSDPAPTPVDDQPAPTQEPPTGKCPTNDLTWVGAFGGNGTYYVRVINKNPVPIEYLLTIR